MDLDRSPAFSFVRWFVRVSWVTVLIGMALSLVILLVSLLAPGSIPPSTRPMLDLGFYGSSMTIRLPAGAVSPEFESRVRPLVFAFALVEGGIAAVVLHELGRILDNMAEHTPFVMENASRMRFIGLAVLSAGVMAMVCEIALASHIADNLRIPGIDLGVKINLARSDIIVVGLIILLLAEVFRYGVQLQDEHDLTV